MVVLGRELRRIFRKVPTLACQWSEWVREGGTLNYQDCVISTLTEVVGECHYSTRGCPWHASVCMDTAGVVGIFLVPVPPCAAVLCPSTPTPCKHSLEAKVMQYYGWDDCAVCSRTVDCKDLIVKHS